MKTFLIILLLATPSLAQQPSPTREESEAQLRKIISQYEADIKRSAYGLACAKEYAEHKNDPSERQLVVSICGGDEAAILPVSDAEYILNMYWRGLRSARNSLTPERNGHDKTSAKISSKTIRIRPAR